MQASDIIAVLPELILLVAACVILLVEPFLKPGAPPAPWRARPVAAASRVRGGETTAGAGRSVLGR